MIPVEEGKTWYSRTLSCLANPAQTFLAAFNPWRPVAQLALPAFTMSANIRPWACRTLSRPTITGAAAIWFRVNMAAAEAPSGARARARSGLPLALIPAAHAENRNPRGGRHLTRPASPAGSESPRRAGPYSVGSAREPSPLHRRRKGWGSERSL